MLSTFKITIMLSFVLTIFAQEEKKTFKVEESIIVEEAKKTEAQIKQELKCLSDSVYKTLWTTNKMSILIQLEKGVMLNKKYYMKVDETHNIMYFKQGETFFMHLNRIVDKVTTVLEKAFYEPGATCARVLNSNCKWRGEREVQYTELCTSGMDVAHQIREDIFKVTIAQEDSSDLNTLKIADAIRSCYKPKCYSISYECFDKGLAMDYGHALKVLQAQTKILEENNYSATLDPYTMTIKYSKLNPELNIVTSPSKK